MHYHAYRKYTGSPELYNYPFIVLDVDISSFVNKILHYIHMGSFSCQMHWSHLMERRMLQK